jgi:hypothetical protein
LTRISKFPEPAPEPSTVKAETKNKLELSPYKPSVSQKKRLLKIRHAYFQILQVVPVHHWGYVQLGLLSHCKHES